MKKILFIALWCVFLFECNTILAQKNFERISSKDLKTDDWNTISLPKNKDGVLFKFNQSPLNFEAYKRAGMWVYNTSDTVLDVTFFLRGSERYKEHTCRYVIPAKDSVFTQVILLRDKAIISQDWKDHLGKVFMYPYDLHPHWRAFDISKIIEVGLKFNTNSKKKFQVKTPSGLGEYTFNQHNAYDLPLPLVDKMGQLNGESWDRKLKNQEELKIQGEKDFNKYVKIDTFENSEFDQYGGWKNGPQFEATGQFYTTKYQGKWYFVNPIGHLFFSVGITGVGKASESPYYGREALFTSDNDMDTIIPITAKGINHYERNLYKKYGEGWKEKHSKVTQGRLYSWNINTYGAWSGVENDQKIPYTLIIHPTTTNFGKMNKIPNPYSETFKKQLIQRLSYLEKHKGNSWNLGIFINNEIHWGKESHELGLAVLNMNQGEAKQVLLKMLKEKYSTIEKLNHAWGVQFNSFKDVKINNIKHHTDIVKNDLEEYTFKHANDYYKMCSETLHKMMPGHLYFGSRIHGEVMKQNKMIQLAASKHCDVVSYNIYEYNVRNFRPLYNADKPVIIGEFHFGVTEHGVWGNGLRYAISSQHQGELYTAYMNGVIEHPNLIGAHWFQWSDQPVTGRKDGENYRIGVVDITDQKFDQITENMKNLSSKIYPLIN